MMMMSISGNGDYLLYTGMGCAVRPPAWPGRYLAEATMSMGGWVVLATPEALHIQLMPGASIPADTGPGGELRWELARALTPPGSGLTRLSVAVASGPRLDQAGVAAEFGRAAAAMARQLATLSVAPPEPGPDAIWDRLAASAKRAQSLRAEGLVAAVLTFRGRGRAIGPLRSDMLMRFGVSAWR